MGNGICDFLFVDAQILDEDSIWATNLGFLYFPMPESIEKLRNGQRDLLFSSFRCWDSLKRCEMGNGIRDYPDSDAWGYK